MKSISFLSLFSLCLLFLFACSSPEPEKTPEEKAREKLTKALTDFSEGMGENLEISGDQLKNAMGEASKALSNLSENMDMVDPVNFRELKKILPNQIGGISQSDAEGSTSGAAGFSVSTASAEYRSNGRNIDLSIVDAGGMGMLTAAAGWFALNIDKETSSGFERTTMINGEKAYEKCEGKNCELAVIVANRFIVSMEGNNISIEDLRAALKDINVNQLKSMAKE